MSKYLVWVTRTVVDCEPFDSLEEAEGYAQERRPHWGNDIISVEVTDYEGDESFLLLDGDSQ